MKMKTYKELFSNDFSPHIEIMHINWIDIKEKDMDIKSEPVTEKKENDPPVTSMELEPIDITIRDIAPKGFFRRK